MLWPRTTRAWLCSLTLSLVLGSPSSSTSSTTSHPYLIDPRTRYQNHSLELPPEAFPVLEKWFIQPPDHGETTYIGSGRLTGRRALITGGDSGIGRAVAIAFVREGAHVAINYLPEEEPDAQSLADFLVQENATIVRIPGDLRNESFCYDLVMESHSQLGGLDILVSNAGYIGHLAGPHHAIVSNLTTAEFDQIVRTNIYASFFLARAAVPIMPPGSNIIYTSSDSARAPNSDLLPYASSKAWIAYWATALAQQVSAFGIRVAAVEPGLVYTPNLASCGYTAEILRTIFQGLIPGRVAQPAELAPLWVDLADPQASYANGAVVNSGGGG